MTARQSYVDAMTRIGFGLDKLSRNAHTAAARALLDDPGFDACQAVMELAARIERLTGPTANGGLGLEAVHLLGQAVENEKARIARSLEAPARRARNRTR